MRRAVVRSRSHEIGVEIVLDGASLLNWRCPSPISGLILTPVDGRSGTIESRALTEPGPSHGIVELSDLASTGYVVTARTSRGSAPVIQIDPGDVTATKNEGRVADAVWTLQSHPGRGLLLISEALSDGHPRVQALESALGAILVTVGPLRETSWEVELRQRGGSARLIGTRRMTTDPMYAAFRFSLPQWTEAALPGSGEITRWDAYAVRAGSDAEAVRLTWGGSSISDVRSAQRFRRSFSRDHREAVTRVRPYWTKDQHLSVELSRLGDGEGAHE